MSSFDKRLRGTKNANGIRERDFFFFPLRRFFFNLLIPLGYLRNANEKGDHNPDFRNFILFVLSRDDEEREGDDIFLEIWNYINFRRFRTNN